MKKILAFILCALILAPTFAACSESPENTETEAASSADDSALTPDETETEAETEPEYISDNLGEHDFGGYNFRIAATAENVTDKILAEDFTGTPVIDAIRTGTVYIEDRFNIKMTSEIYPNEAKAFQTVINAGEDAFDIETGSDWILYPMAQDGMFYDLFDVEQFDFTKPWWPAHLTETLTIAGSMYTAANYLSYQGIHWTRALIINKDLAEELNLEVPYDTIREGKWTLDTMFSFVEGTSFDENGDGKISAKDDIIGYLTGTQTSYCLQESMGISPYVRGEDGNIQLDIDLERIDTFVTKMREFMATDDFLDSGDHFGDSIFRQGNTLLVYTQLGDAYDIYSAEDFTYGFLTTPKFDELQENYINCCTDTPWAFPVTLSEEQLDIDGVICEALSCYNYQHVLPAYFDVAMKSRLSDSPDDAEQLQLIADTRTTSFCFAYSLNFNNILGDLQYNDRGVSSYIQSNTKIAKKSLEKLIKDFAKIKEERS